MATSEEQNNVDRKSSEKASQLSYFTVAKIEEGETKNNKNFVKLYLEKPNAFSSFVHKSNLIAYENENKPHILDAAKKIEVGDQIAVSAYRQDVTITSQEGKKSHYIDYVAADAVRKLQKQVDLFVTAEPEVISNLQSGKNRIELQVSQYTHTSQDKEGNEQKNFAKRTLLIKDDMLKDLDVNTIAKGNLITVEVEGIIKSAQGRDKHMLNPTSEIELKYTKEQIQSKTNNQSQSTEQSQAPEAPKQTTQQEVANEPEQKTKKGRGKNKSQGQDM